MKGISYYILFLLSLTLLSSELVTVASQDGKKLNKQESLDSVKNMLERLKVSEPGTDEQKTVLHGLEDLLHHIDYAEYFAEKGGIKLLCDMLKNHAKSDSVADILFAFSAAARSNPKVQSTAADSGCIAALEAALKHTSNRFRKQDLDTESVHLQISRLLTAYSSLILGSQHAQGLWYKSYGLNVFATIYDQVVEKVMANPEVLGSYLPHMLKSFTFLSDLINEQYNKKEEMPKYFFVIARTFEDLMKDTGWCRRLYEVLWAMHEHPAALPHLRPELIDKLIRILHEFDKPCPVLYTGELTKKTLHKMQAALRKAVADEPTKEYLREGLSIADELVVKSNYTMKAEEKENVEEGEKAKEHVEL